MPSAERLPEHDAENDQFGTQPCFHSFLWLVLSSDIPRVRYQTYQNFLVLRSGVIFSPSRAGRARYMAFTYRILVVDDDAGIRQVSKLLLASHGYDVQTAGNGFEALVALRESSPDIIISDLKMPNMSGFEFLSAVRKRFPQIATIAISGEYNGIRPIGLLADAFFAKANYRPEQLFEKIAELIKASPLRANLAKGEYAPVWLPRSTTGYYVLTCTECLRSFSVPAAETAPGDEVQETECIFCGTAVKYLIEANGDYAAPPKSEAG